MKMSLRVQYIWGGGGIAVTLVSRPFSIFYSILRFKHSAVPRTWNRVQYLDDGDVSKVTWFQKMMADLS
jgi:hypothetical protein